VQFIATTHSPFIVQSLRAEELINLDQISETLPQDLSINDISTLFMVG
jgi:predicted ATP-binding protein involved in virulence